MSDSVAQSPPNSHSNVCILLLGKTGHGKSATGNSILGTKPFKSSARTDSVTENTEMASTNVSNREIKVVDTPGICDTKLAPEEEDKKAIQALKTAVALCPEGFQVLILVFKFGTRMSEEEKGVIEKLKEILGQNVIRDHVVLVITHGDNFDPEEEQMSFADWCRAQSGYMRELLQECDRRCVLFNNKTRDEAELFRQRKELLDFVDVMNSKGKIYTTSLFEQAIKTWEKLTRERKYAPMFDKVKEGLENISMDLKTIEGGTSEVDDAYFERFREKLATLRGVIFKVEEPEKGKMEIQIKDMEINIQKVQAQKNEEKKKSEAEQLRRKLQQEEEERQRQLQKQAEEQKKEQDRMAAEIRQLEEERRRQQEWEAQQREAHERHRRHRHHKDCLIA